MLTGTVLSILIVGVIFLVVVLNVAAYPKLYMKVSKWLVIVTSVSSLLIYGYGFAYVYEDQPLYAMARTLLAVCGTYIGRNEYDAISSVPGYSTWGFQIIFWLLQVIAIYTLFSAVLAALGEDMVKSLRRKRAGRGDLVLIYGAGGQALDFGRSCQENKHLSVLYIVRRPDPAALSSIDEMGAAYRTDEAALLADRSFLKSIHAGNGKAINLYCLDEDAWEDYEYACALKQSFVQAGIDGRRVTAAIIGREESGMEKTLIDNGADPGFGNVTVFDRYSLAARLLIRTSRPWEEMHFDPATCQAKEDFSVLLLGFGRYGQSILRQLVRNGQFCGSTFHAVVVDRHPEQTAGLLLSECRAMFERYDIKMVQEDVRSLSFYHYFEQEKTKLKMIVLALGGRENNQEAADQLMLSLEASSLSVPVVSCSDAGILCQRAGTAGQRRCQLFSSRGMDFAGMDAMAMEVNHTYMDGSNSAEEDWKNCDYFGRMSSRASADFIPAMLWSMGMTVDEAEAFPGHSSFTVSQDGASDPAAGILSPVQAQNLGRTEHARWCAFHYSMGYAPMGWDEWEARAGLYREQKEKGMAKRIKIGKNTDDRRHICIMPWEELDELSQRENAVTGASIDYQQIDINNVLAIPKVLQMYKENQK